MQTSVLLLSTKVTSNTLLQMPVKQVSYTTKIMRCPLTIKRQQAAMKINKRIYHKWICWQIQAQTTTLLRFVELCAKILQTMRNDFKDYACTFCQLFLPLFAKNLFRFCITHSRIQDRPILCLWDRQNSFTAIFKNFGLFVLLGPIGCTNIS